MYQLLKGAQTPKKNASPLRTGGNSCSAHQGLAVNTLKNLPPPFPVSLDSGIMGSAGKRMSRRWFSLTGYVFVFALFNGWGVTGQVLTKKACHDILSAAYPNIKVVSDFTDWSSTYGITPISAKSSSILTHFNNDSVITKTLLIDGDVEVDSSIVFASNCNVFFTQGSSFEVPSRLPVGLKFEAYNSSFSGACKVMWSGIEAADTTAKIVLVGDTVRGMLDGIQSSSGAFLQIVNNQFINNDKGISLKNYTFSKPVADYRHQIELNAFKTLPGGLDTPYQATLAGSYGIYAFNCMDLRIGNRLVPQLGNYFENLVTGVFYKNTSSVRGSFLNYHSIFKKIRGFADSTAYRSEKGSCIHVSNKSDSFLIVEIGGNSNLTSMKMSDADKGIVAEGARSLLVNSVKMDSITLGIAENKTGARIVITNNVMDSIYMGIQIDGAPAALSEISSNRISTLPRAVAKVNFGPAAAFQIAEGISVSYPSTFTSSNNTWTIKDNKINIFARKGLGIHVEVARGGLNINDNLIKLLPPSTTAYGTTLLHAGIYLRGCDSMVSLNRDTVLGNSRTFKRETDSTKLPKISSSGKGEPSGVTSISTPAQIRCCYFDSLRNGLQFIGNCNVGSTTINNFRIQGNKIVTAGLGMLFRATEQYSSTNPPPYYFNNMVGRYIGSTTFDNNNEFLGAYYDDFGLGPIKIWVAESDTVISCSSQPRFIYTSNMTFNQSKSNVFDCRYRVDNGTSSQYNCPNSPSQMQSGNRNHLAGVFEINEKELARAEQIARGDYAVSVAFPATYWLNARNLYEQLRQMPEVLLVSQILDSFYNSNLGGVFDQIREAEDAFSVLTDTMVQRDGTLRAAVFADIAQKTAAISVSNVFEENERDMLRLLLDNEQEGYDGLDTDEKSLIEALAASCRYVAGTAVEKARFLYQVLHVRSYYDDGSQCEATAMAEVESRGVNRQMSTVTTTCHVAPNPANQQLQIVYSLGIPASQIVFELRDMTGVIVRAVKLPLDNSRAVLDVSGFMDGIYYYRLIADGAQQSTGKVLIQH